MPQKIISFTILVLFLLSSCSTYKVDKTKLGTKNELTDISYTKTDIKHRFYLVGDAGKLHEGKPSPVIRFLEDELKNEEDNTTLLFLGDNIYPSGLPKKSNENREIAEKSLLAQLNVSDNFKGQTIYIPGNHDWYSGGIEGLEREQKFVDKYLQKKGFFSPGNGCPLEKIKISKDIILITIDTQWFLANWDKEPKINDDCSEIKTRTKFFDEIESLIKKNRDKKTIIAMHHPLKTNGSHGGYFTAKNQLFPFGNKIPLPFIGSLVNLVRATGGISVQDIQNSRYNELSQRLWTLAQESDNVIFVSGHDHNLQFIKSDGNVQIISGSASKKSGAKASGDVHFSYGNLGYVVLDVLNNGKTYASFYSVEDTNKLIYKTEVLESKEEKNFDHLQKINTKTYKASIYKQSEVEKSGFFKLFWGEHYRKYFGVEVDVPIVYIDTMLGGLKPIRKGGGHQSRSLRLEDKEGRQFVMRALKKSAVQYLQAVAFKKDYFKEDLKETYTEELLNDVFTASHPYAPFVVGELSNAVNVYHTNPLLCYVPKHAALGKFNEDFGDELYMIEERPADNREDIDSFGNSKKIVNTDDLFKYLRKDESYKLDQKAFARARVFDMLIGDWDRHEDQWRWAQFEENGEKIFRPIPRDRDQAFSRNDGSLMQVATRLIPAIRAMQTYGSKIRSEKWFNMAPYRLDIVLTNNQSKEDWLNEAKFIQENLTDDIIERAFMEMPKEVRDSTVDEIKDYLKKRRENIVEITSNYLKELDRIGVVLGTDKDDIFEINRESKGVTNVKVFRNKKGVKSDKTFDKTFYRKDTKEIWIYGLDDKDTFYVNGDGNKEIKVRVIGGQNHDEFVVENPNKVILYDFKTKKNTVSSEKKVRTKFFDDYETNLFDFKKFRYNQNQILPNIGYNPDNGIKIGVMDTYTTYGFERNPFTSKHIIKANYFFATSGFELEYDYERANVFGNWNFGLHALYTSPNYNLNYFGLGNNTLNYENEKGMDYNRVRLLTFEIAPSLRWKGDFGAEFAITAFFENKEIEDMDNRYVNDINLPEINFEHVQYFGLDFHYTYKAFDNPAYPGKGMSFDLNFGWKNNQYNKQNFGYVKSSIAFTHQLESSGSLVLASSSNAKAMIGDGFYFYDASSIGGNNGLRGYRNERFTGDQYFFQQTDLRLRLAKLRSSLVPIQYGIFGGYDVGKVWVNDGDSKGWNDSLGGGFWLSAADMISVRLTFFNSEEDNRFSFGLGYSF